MHPLALLHRFGHGGRTCGLYSVDLDVRAQGLYGERHSGNEAATSDRHHYRLDFRHLFKYLQSDCALTGDYLGVVEGMDEGVTFLLLQLQGLGVSVIIDSRNQTHLCPESFGGLDFRDGRTCRQANERLYAVLGGGEGHTLGVVTG